MREILMSYKPDYIKEAIKRKSSIFILKPGEVCIIDCSFSKDYGVSDGICPGKNSKRNYDYTCDYLDVAASYKRGLERDAKEFAEAVAKRKEKRQ